MEIDSIQASSTRPKITASKLSRNVLQRRKNYESTSLHVAAYRNDLYREVSIDQLVPLVFHTTPSLLESSQDVNAVIEDVSEEYKKNKSDLFNDWQRYCKALDSHQRAVATFGMRAPSLPI